MHDPASNRQRKLLRFFDVRFGPNIGYGAAGWEVAYLLSDDDRRARWRKYLYLTKDFDSDSDELKPFNQEELDAIVVPEDWHSSDEIQRYRDELVSNFLENNAPFDNPEPLIGFAGATFAFTGKFNFGSRKVCREAVEALGGIAPDKPTINRNMNYLVIGTQGSPSYKRGFYGTKIEKAIISRREFGAPSIVSEDHWAQQMSAST